MAVERKAGDIFVIRDGDEIYKATFLYGNTYGDVQRFDRETKAYVPEDGVKEFNTQNPNLKFTKVKHLQASEARGPSGPSGTGMGGKRRRGKKTRKGTRKSRRTTRRNRFT